MIERRFIETADTEPLEVEERSGSAPKIRGLAAVYNSKSRDLGGFREVIEPGAFDHLLARKRQDVVALWNHETGSLLGRTTSGTLRLWSDDKGLRYEIDPPETTLARDLLTLVRRGDISGSSFAFTVAEGDERYVQEEDGSTTRYIRKASNLYDVSLVTQPAYDATAVSVRSFQAWQAEQSKVPFSESQRWKATKSRAAAVLTLARCVGALLLVMLVMSDAHAIGRRRSSGSSYAAAPAGGDTSTAQGVAEACARMGRLAHMGGNGGMMEGIGMASTPAAAIRNCCFYGKIAIQDKGVAQGSNGMWYACIRGR